ncbi:MAG: glutamine synthetase type III, partial [Firmicutes bacterium]|nr:glutamine synthetase type III [Bacillota bacterium]
VAEALSEFADELEGAADFETALHDLIRKTIRAHKRIVFNGNGYDASWLKEAAKRGLLNYRTTAEAMPHLLDKKNVAMLTKQGVYTKEELVSRCEIMLENYCKTVIIEANTMASMATREIAPAVSQYVADLAEEVYKKQRVDKALACAFEKERIAKLSVLTDRIAAGGEALKDLIATLGGDDYEAKSVRIAGEVIPAMDALRKIADEAETLIAKEYWPMPSYGKLLFGGN